MAGIHSVQGFGRRTKFRSSTCEGSFGDAGDVGQSNFICGGFSARICWVSGGSRLSLAAGNGASACWVGQHAVQLVVRRRRWGTLTWRGKYSESGRKEYRQNYFVFSFFESF